MDISAQQKQFFTRQLLAWHHNDNGRDLPWKSEQDPYRIWLSEVILQQTRALQGLPYYNEFTRAYPTIDDMAAATDEDVFRIWQGLGYYNRCRNMLATARHIASRLGGRFPETHEGILALKGVGPYTAAAIASFAYGLPHAVVDGNVYRVLSRYFGIDTPFDTTAGKKIFAGLAQQLLDTSDSAAYNQAIMDLGATVCSPKKPLCAGCALQKNCVAFARNLTALLHVRSKKTAVATRYFHYLVLKWQDEVLISQRTQKAIWESLHEPLLIEHTCPLGLADLQGHPGFAALQLAGIPVEYSGSLSQRLTHRIIETRFFTAELHHKPEGLPAGGSWLPASALKKIAFPKTVVTFLKNNLYF